MVHLVTILVVLIGNLVLSIYTVLDLLKMSILIPHERCHDCIDLPERLLSILQRKYLLCIPLVNQSIRSASFVPGMLVIETNVDIIFAAMAVRARGRQGSILAKRSPWRARTGPPLINTL